MRCLKNLFMEDESLAKNNLFSHISVVVAAIVALINYLVSPSTFIIVALLVCITVNTLLSIISDCLLIKYERRKKDDM